MHTLFIYFKNIKINTYKNVFLENIMDNMKQMKTIKFGLESNDRYEVTDAWARSIIETIESKLALKLDKSIVKTSNPTQTTIGMVGQTYINAVTEGVFICIKADNTNKKYIWKDISEVDLSNYYTKTEIDSKISSVYSFKGSVVSESNLPTTANIGDVYNVEDTGMNYAWTGTEWDSLGTINDLSIYLTKNDAEKTYQTIENSYTKSEVDNIIKTVDSLPKQTDNAGKVLVTDGTTASWDYVINMNNLTESTSAGVSNLVINKLTQAEYDELKANGLVKDNEIYLTSDEYYTKKEVDEIIENINISSSSTYIFEQNEPSTEWLVKHNLNKYPYIVTVDLNGEEFYGEKMYIDNNTVKITFSTPISGKVYLN